MRYLLLGLAACGGGSTQPIDAPPIDAPADVADVAIDAFDSVNPGFIKPTTATHANLEVNDAFTDLGPANWNCLGTPAADQPSTQALSLAGKLVDYQNRNVKTAATAEAFAASDLATLRATATTNANGDFSHALPMLPSGTTRFSFRFTAANQLTTYRLNEYFPPNNATPARTFDSVSTSTANALPALVGEQRLPATGIHIGVVVDCDGHQVSHAIATVSSTPAIPTHLTTSDTFYYSATAGLPVRHTQAQSTDQDGRFMIIDVPVQSGAAFTQVWGYRSDGDLAADTLSLLAELHVPLQADIAVMATFEPRRQ